MITRRSINYILLAIVLDFMCLVAALAVASTLRATVELGPNVPGVEDFPPAVVVVVILFWQSVMAARGIYAPNRSLPVRRELREVIVASLFALLLLAGTLYFSYRLVSRYLIGYFLASSVLFLAGWRVLFHVARRALRRKIHLTRRVLVVGCNPISQQVADAVRRHDDMELVGFVDDGSAADVLGTTADLPALIDQHRIDDIVIALRGEAYQTLHTIIADLEKKPVHISIAPDFVSLALHHAQAELLDGLPVISLRASALGGYQRLIKRMFDIVVTVPLLVVTAPIMLAVAAAVRLSSPGGVIFSQQRVGENGRLFTIYKFRTMADGSAEIDVPDKNRADGRVTGVGRVLRRFSLDELPQLWNVLKGDMSLVGPRPEVPHKMDTYQTWQRKRLAVPPGMTGWWQVTGRGEKPLHLHTEDDLYYIAHYSILLDIQILLRTVVAVLSGRGAF